MQLDDLMSGNPAEMLKDPKQAEHIGYLMVTKLSAGCAAFDPSGSSQAHFEIGAFMGLSSVAGASGLTPDQFLEKLNALRDYVVAHYPKVLEMYARRDKATRENENGFG